MDDPADPDGSLVALLHRADPAALLAEVERACSRRDWPHLFALRDGCRRAAAETGRQLWAVAQYVDYRLALEAPAAIAAGVVKPGAARFALGPLTEVVASRHAWLDLADHLDVPVIAATVAQERVLRGEDLRGDVRASAWELELPLVLADWEPDPPLARYEANRRIDGRARDPERGWQSVEGHGRPVEPVVWPSAIAAANDLIGHWASASTGAVRVEAVAAPAPRAIAARAGAGAEMVALYLDEAIERCLAASASGGAHGRRRGLAAARSSTWWLLHHVAQKPWPSDVAALGDALDGLGWYAYRDEVVQGGWQLRLAIESPDTATTLLIDASDRPDAADREPTHHADTRSAP